MKTNPFDQQIKQTLEQSPLPLPEHSWARLNKQLNQAEARTQRRRRSYRWGLMAASFALLLGLGYQLGWNTPIRQVDPAAIPVQSQVATATAKPDAKQVQSAVVESFSAPLTRKHRTPMAVSALAHQSVAIVASTPVQMQSPTQGSAVAPATTVAVTTPSPVAPSAGQSSNADYLRMLDGVKAQPQSVQVPPQQLYESVDGERQREYRENVFGRVYKKYQSVREAVAQRNQQE